MSATSENRNEKYEEALMEIIEKARTFKSYVDAPYRRPVKAVAERERLVMFLLYGNARSAAEGLGLTDEEFNTVLNMPPSWRASWQSAFPLRRVLAVLSPRG
jgi:hypothetical protein